MSPIFRTCSRFLNAIFALYPCISFGTRTSATHVDGTIPFVYDGKTYQTYYKVFGNLSGALAPLVVLHGGPGLTHDYLLPISDLATSIGIPIVFYDQLGNGRSTHLSEKPHTFWTIDLFVDELENLLAHFEITDAFDVIGHSWGGMLGAEFEVRRRPEGLRHLILSDAPAATDLWVQSNQQLAQAFPMDVQQGLAVGMNDLAQFWAALQIFNAVHGCTVMPTPKEVTYSFEQIFGENGDPTVSTAPIMQGWSIIDRLHRVHVSTLLINGCNDVAQNFVVAPFYQHIPSVKWITFENASHTPFWEMRAEYMRLVGSFLGSP